MMLALKFATGLRLAKSIRYAFDLLLFIFPLQVDSICAYTEECQKTLNRKRDFSKLSVHVNMFYSPGKKSQFKFAHHLDLQTVCSMSFFPFFVIHQAFCRLNLKTIREEMLKSLRTPFYNGWNYIAKKDNFLRFPKRVLM